MKAFGYMKKWFLNNLAAIVLIIAFIPIFILTQFNDRIIERIGTTSIEYLDNEYYRWITCIFYHYDYGHIFFNSVALICVGSLLTPFIGNLKTIILFLLGGALAEIPFSLLVHYGEAIYGGGSSGGIFALTAALLVCWLRFPGAFRFKRYRPDLLIVLAYFVLANDNQSSFLTHSFGFIAGILFATGMVIFGFIRYEPKA